jgi:hypothetical protein
LWEKSKSGANFPTFLGTGSTERGMAYGKMGTSERVFVVSRLSGVNIIILNAATGDSIGTLKTTNITGGTYPLNDIDVSSDSVIFAANMSVGTGSDSLFKIYKWKNLTSDPEKVIEFNTTKAGGYHIGDKITVTGSTADNSIAIWVAVASKAKMIKFTTTDNGATFTATEITLTATVGSTPSVAPINNGADGFYIKANGNPLVRFSATGTALDTISTAVSATGSNALRYFELLGKKYLVTYNYGTNSNENMSVIDVTDGTKAAQVVFKTLSMGAQANANGTGDVAVRTNSDGTIDIMGLATNNGMSAYKVAMPFAIAKTRDDVNNDFVPDMKGAAVTVSGIVVTPDYTASSTGNTYYIFDGQAGVAIRATKKLSTQLSVGDSVVVKGYVDQYKGLNQIALFDSVVSSTGSVIVAKTKVAVPAPIEVTVKDVNSEKYEGSLVKVKGLSKTATSPAWPAAGKNAVMRVAVGADSVMLYIDLDTDIDGTTEVKWPQDITGVVTQLTGTTPPNNAYELMPTSIADFQTSVVVDTIPSATIAQARIDADNDFVPDNKGKYFKITGTVISPDFTASAGGNNYYISDGVSGVLMYSAKKISAALNIGDSVLVRGKIDQYNGVTEFVPIDTLVGDKGSIVVIKSGAKVPAPIEITLKDLNSEKYEGCLVVVKGLNKTSTSPAWPAAGKNANMKVFAGTDTTTLFIDLDSDVDGTTEVVWPQDITGIATQFASKAPYNSGYEILPRSVADFKKSTVGVASEAKIPTAYGLDQNYPNPFNPTTAISFDLKASANVNLRVFNLLGQEVANILNNRAYSAGHQIVNFSGSNLTSGIYIYKLEVRGFDGSNFSAIKKMMLLK